MVTHPSNSEVQWCSTPVILWNSPARHAGLRVALAVVIAGFPFNFFFGGGEFDDSSDEDFSVPVRVI